MELSTEKKCKASRYAAKLIYQQTDNKVLKICFQTSFEWGLNKAMLNGKSTVL